MENTLINLNTLIIKPKLIVNTDAVKVDYTLTIKTKNLFVIGWDFEEHIQSLKNTSGLSYVDAKISVMNRIVILHFERNKKVKPEGTDEPEEIEEMFFWSFGTNEMERFSLPINEAIESLLTIVNNDLQTFNSIRDYSKRGFEINDDLCDFLIIETP